MRISYSLSGAQAQTTSSIAARELTVRIIFSSQTRAGRPSLSGRHRGDYSPKSLWRFRYRTRPDANTRLAAKPLKLSTNGGSGSNTFCAPTTTRRP